MADEQLILRHFALWLEQQAATADVPLVGTLLDLRSTYDDLEPTHWPSGSVADLLLRRWPSKGDVEAPDPEVLTASLEAWFKFLRNTGRMSSRSAEVKELVKECRRAAPEMADVASERAGWSPTKALMEFGRSQGIDLDDVPDVQTMQARLEETNRRWNDLPVFERQRLMPSPGSGGLSERERLFAAYRTEDPIIALLCSVANEMPDPRSVPPALVAPHFAESPYLRSLLELAAWAEDGKPLTATGNLRVRPALEAYDLLGLEQWTRDLARLEYDVDPPLPGPAAMGMEAWLDREVERARPARSAGDCDALERLIRGGVAAGVLIDDGRRLVGRPPTDLDNQGWRDFGLRAAVGVLEWLRERSSHAAIVTQTILRSYVHSQGAVSLDEMSAFYDAWVFSPEDRASFESDRTMSDAYTGGTVNHALGLVADLGILDVDRGSVCLTDAGDEFVWVWLDYVKQQALEPDQS